MACPPSRFIVAALTVYSKESPILSMSHPSIVDDNCIYWESRINEPSKESLVLNNLHPLLFHCWANCITSSSQCWVTPKEVSMNKGPFVSSLKRPGPWGNWNHLKFLEKFRMEVASLTFNILRFVGGHPGRFVAWGCPPLFSGGRFNKNRWGWMYLWNPFTCRGQLSNFLFPGGWECENTIPWTPWAVGKQKTCT